MRRLACVVGSLVGRCVTVGVLVVGATGQVHWIGEQPLVEVVPRDLALAPDGSFAVVRSTAEPAFDPPAVSCLNNLRVTGQGFFAGGDANDVALTPNHAYAIVNHRNWIHVLHMRTGNVLAAYNVGDLLGGSTPDGAVDSVVASNTAAVVTTNGQAGALAYVITLGPTPMISMAIALGGGAIHDLALTPDGTKAVITTSEGLVAALDVATGTPFVFTDLLSRPWATMRDSVEVTDTLAVVIGNDVQGAKPKWNVRVFSIASVTGATQLEESAAFDAPEPGTELSDLAHDLALTPDGAFAVVKTELHNVVVSLAGTPTAQVLASEGNPLSGQTAEGQTFVSDSVVATASSAVTIGTRWIGGTPVQLEARIDFLALDPVTSTQTTVSVAAANPAQGERVSAGDLALLPGETDPPSVAVHLRGRLPDDPGATSGQDVFVYTLAGVLQGRFGATGDVLGIDSLEANLERIVTLGGQYLDTSPNQFPVPGLPSPSPSEVPETTDGWVRFVGY